MFKPKGKPSKPKKEKKSMKASNIFVISVVIFAGMTVWGLWLIDRGLEPILVQIATEKSDQIASYALNVGINKKGLRYMQENTNQPNEDQPSTREKMDRLVIKEYNEDGELTDIQFNTYEVNKMLVETTQTIQQFLRAVENGKINPSKLHLGSYVKFRKSNDDDNNNDTDNEMDKNNSIVYTIPLGAATNNALLANLGPEIPVRFEMIGSVKTEVIAETKEAGINMVFLQLSVKMKVDVRVVIPFATKTQTVSTEYPIAQEFIPGDVPLIYNMGSNGKQSMTPTLSIKELKELNKKR